MPWIDFIGNAAIVDQVRRLVVGRRAQRALVLSGPEGVGKTTLAIMLGLALNCRTPPAPGDFCGACPSCLAAVPPDELPALIEAALEYREQEVKSAPRENAPLAVAPHPAIRLYPPDGDSLTIHQARSVIHQNQLQPDPGLSWCLILPDFDQARWMVQAALLKTLEEPAPHVTLIALARNPLELLPTVRSRALMLALQPLEESALAAFLEARLPEVGGGGGLLARLAQGCPGRALRLDLPAYRLLRAEALDLLRAALDPARASAALRLTESTRAGKDKFESLLEILYSVLQDILYLQSGFTEAVRNVDCVPELAQLARRLTPSGLPPAIEGLDRIHSAARRNAFRPLALDAWALDLSARR